jgi:hypothetical protein
MQDHEIKTPDNSRIVRSEKPGELPPDFLERLAASDVVILIGSSESQDQELSMHTILPGGLFDPGHVLSHAYAHALHGEHVDLVRKVRGLPTDALRYRGLAEFASLAGTDNERFEKINAALQAFEEAEGLADEATTRSREDFDRIADFVLQALIETEPADQVPDQDGDQAEQPAAPSIILPN